MLGYVSVGNVNLIKCTTIGYRITEACFDVDIDSCCSPLNAKHTAIQMFVSIRTLCIWICITNSLIYGLCVSVSEREKASLINDESCDAVCKATDLLIHSAEKRCDV